MESFSLAAPATAVARRMAHFYVPIGVVRRGFFPGEADHVSLSYRSERGLCHFAEGLALGAGDLFGERFTVTQPVCQHTGGDHCELLFTWPADGR